MANLTGKKFGGRKKGSVNKISAKVKEKLSDLIVKNMNKLNRELNKLEGKEFIKAITPLLPYVTSKMSESDININNNENQFMTIQLMPVSSKQDLIDVTPDQEQLPPSDIQDVVIENYFFETDDLIEKENRLED